MRERIGRGYARWRNPLRASIVFLLFSFSADLFGSNAGHSNSVPSHNSLKHEAYVWQRVWTESLRKSLRTHTPEMQGLVVLAAQVDWNGASPTLVRPQVDYTLLAALQRPAGLAMRISSYRGPMNATHPTARFLCDVAKEVLTNAHQAGVDVSELQVDFDCSESKLAEYRSWLGALREAVKPVPLTFTALPAWLGRPAFRPLAESADGYVLQVHSLQPSKGSDPPWTLGDPAAARTAVRRASTFGRPFRIALPTYAYLVAEDAKGRFVGVSAEGPSGSWPPGTRVREVWSDPLAMSELVRNWQVERPPHVTGIIWYRFPAPDDTLNWRWPTLSAIVASRIPSERVRVESRRVETALVEISVLNEGELDISSRIAIDARWQGARLRAADALRGFELVRREPVFARFESPKKFRLRAGDRCVIGWLRLSEECEVRSEIELLRK